MRKSTTLRFAVLLGLLSLAAWLPAGTAEAASCSLIEGQYCTSYGAVKYCEKGGETVACTCTLHNPGGIGFRWACPPI